jgi:hypothetical protein
MGRAKIGCVRGRVVSHNLGSLVSYRGCGHCRFWERQFHFGGIPLSRVFFWVHFTAVDKWSLPRVAPCGDLDWLSLQRGFDLENEVSLTQG